jgi:cytochrome oxidase Cu insertion factor (SCO1/SenC/PrrC family)
MSGAGDLLGVASLLLAVATAALWFRRIFAVRIPEDRTAWVAAFVAASVLGIASFAVGNETFGAVAAGIGIGLGGFMAGTRAISRQSDKRPAVQVGSPILDFTAPDENGAPFDLAGLRGRPFLLKFFRGHW